MNMKISLFISDYHSYHSKLYHSDEANTETIIEEGSIKCMNT
jgi:hypothetical protein